MTGMPKEKVDKINSMMGIIKKLEQDEQFAKVSRVLEEAEKSGDRQGDGDALHQRAGEDRGHLQPQAGNPEEGQARGGVESARRTTRLRKGLKYSFANEHSGRRV